MFSSNKIAVQFSLQAMRNPDSIISHVHEKCDIFHGSIKRDVTIKITVPRYARSEKTLLLDVLHPKRGELEDIEFEPGSQCQVAGHNEHQRFSSALILQRFSTWTKTVRVSETKYLDKAMENLHVLSRDMSKIPLVTKNEAKNLLTKHFDESGKLKNFLVRDDKGEEFSLIIHDSVQLDFLYQLCNRLADRYLLLVQFKVNKSGRAVIKFGHTKVISGRMSESFKKIPWARKKLWHLRTATSVRVPIPWAKRTRDYRFATEAPQGMFNSWSDVVDSKGELIRYEDPHNKEVAKSQGAYFRFATNQHDGRKLSYFLEGAQKVKIPLYIAVKLRELPGLSTTQMTRFTLITLLLLTSTLILDQLTTVKLSDLGALIIALLAAFASFNLRADYTAESTWPLPALSRVTPLVVGIASCTYAMWVLTKSSAARWGGDSDFFGQIWSGWQKWGWIPSVSLVTVLFGWLNYRRHEILQEFRSTHAVLLERLITEKREEISCESGF